MGIMEATVTGCFKTKIIVLPILGISARTLWLCVKNRMRWAVCFLLMADIKSFTARFGNVGTILHPAKRAPVNRVPKACIKTSFYLKAAKIVILDI